MDEKGKKNDAKNAGQTKARLGGKLEVLRAKPRIAGKQNYLALRARLKNVLEEKEKQEFDREEEDVAE